MNYGKLYCAKNDFGDLFDDTSLKSASNEGCAWTLTMPIYAIF
jgi:hypothetical protein